MNVFVYGALMVDPRVSASGRAATVDGWAVRFCARGVPLLEPSFAGLVEAPGDVAHGVVVTVSRAAWANLSRAEIIYEQRRLTAETADGSVPCVGLVVPDRFRISERPPSARYASKLARGAADAGLPEAVVAHYRELARTGSHLSTRMPWVVPLVGSVPNVGVIPAVALVLFGALAAPLALGWGIVALLRWF